LLLDETEVAQWSFPVEFAAELQRFEESDLLLAEMRIISKQ